MTLFMLLLVLAWERVFKLGEIWQLDQRIVPLFARLHQVSLRQTLLLTGGWMLLVALAFWLLNGILYHFLSFVLALLLCLLCIGAGGLRQYYRAYLQAAKQGDQQAAWYVSQELALIHGLSRENEQNWLNELQNALLWINYRFYLAPLFWLVLGTSLIPLAGPLFLAGYALLRAYQSYLARHRTELERAESGVDRILQCLDWLPVRLAGLAYAVLGHGERALPAWVASLADLRTPPYQVLTHLAQFSLARYPQNDLVATPLSAVELAKQVTLVIVIAVAVLTIIGIVL